MVVRLLATNMWPKLDQLTKQYFSFPSGQRGTIFFASADAPLLAKKIIKIIKVGKDNNKVNIGSKRILLYYKLVLDSQIHSQDTLLTFIQLIRYKRTTSRNRIRI